MRTMKLLDLLQMPNVLILDCYGDTVEWGEDATGIYLKCPASDESTHSLCQDLYVDLQQEQERLTFSLIDNDDTESWFTLHLYKPLTFEHLLQISLGIPATEL